MWHPGTTPPYSSLWITVQRFLILNQPTRQAFAQDFMRHPTGCTRISLNPNGSGSASCPIRLARFARVLREPMETFRYAHISQFPTTVWPLFGDFAVCPDCLRDGFHSILFSFNGLTQCPVHGEKLRNRICCEATSNAIVLHEKLDSLGKCLCGEPFLNFARARSPKASPQRDQALAEVVECLMHAGSRHWLGPQNSLDSKQPMEQFTQRIARIKIALNSAGVVPGWAVTSDLSPLDSSTLEIMTFGSAKIDVLDQKDNVIQWISASQTSPYAYQETIFSDFKAINRYLRHHTLGEGRRWISQFARARSTLEIRNMLATGGEEAQRAWAVLIWWQTCIWDLNLQNWFSSRPFRLVSVLDVPTLIDRRKKRPSFLPQANNAQEWITRWVSALGLIAFWRHTLEVAASDRAPCLAMIGKGLSGTRTLPDWSLGISGNDRLVLCVDRSIKPDWKATPRLDRSERRARFRIWCQNRLADARVTCGQACIWYHANSMEWVSGPGPIPVELADCKRHRMLPASRQLWFYLFTLRDADGTSRAFVARCLTLPLAATGPSPRETVRHLKFATNRYLGFQVANATSGS